jgi:glycine cleavage system H protein
MGKWNIPNGYKYARSDEWIKVEGEEALIGVSDYAQDSLSDVVFVELPGVGDALEAGKAFGTIESVKAASELISPVSGTVVAVNSVLEDAPEKINDAPYDSWLIRIKPSNLGELDALLDADAYAKFCEERG